MIRKSYISLGKEKFRKDVLLFVHEMMHPLFFHPYLYKFYPKVKRRNKVTKKRELVDSVYVDDSGVSFMRGWSVTRNFQLHTGCKWRPDGKNFLDILFLEFVYLIWIFENVDWQLFFWKINCLCFLFVSSKKGKFKDFYTKFDRLWVNFRFSRLYKRIKKAVKFSKFR